MRERATNEYGGTVVVGVAPWDFLTALVFGLLFTLVSCSEESTPACAADRDCPTNECAQGRCVTLDDADAGDATTQDVMDDENEVEDGEATPSCRYDGDCEIGEWCPTNTTERRCSPRPSLGSAQMPFQYVPAGSFTLGSSTEEFGHIESETQIDVTLTRAFYMQRTELTQEQWTALSGGVNPSCFQSRTGANCSNENRNPAAPVEMVTWWSVLEYANALSRHQGLPECYRLPTSGCGGRWQTGTLYCGNVFGPAVVGDDVYGCAGYRLPTEAEWEYAARAGTTTATYAGDLIGDIDACDVPQQSLDEIAWWCGNAGGRTRAVGGRSPNALGLFDMLGNVWELTWNRTSGLEDAEGGTDPRSTSAGAVRVIRGGGWAQEARYVRTAIRGRAETAVVSAQVGVRLVRKVPWTGSWVIGPL